MPEIDVDEQKWVPLQEAAAAFFNHFYATHQHTVRLWNLEAAGCARDRRDDYLWMFAYYLHERFFSDLLALTSDPISLCLVECKQRLSFATRYAHFAIDYRNGNCYIVEFGGLNLPLERIPRSTPPAVARFLCAMSDFWKKPIVPRNSLIPKLGCQRSPIFAGFLALPREIRDAVYGRLCQFGHSTYQHCGGQYQQRYIVEASISGLACLTVSRQVSQEFRSQLLRVSKAMPPIVLLDSRGSSIPAPALLQIQQHPLVHVIYHGHQSAEIMMDDNLFSKLLAEDLSTLIDWPGREPHKLHVLVFRHPDPNYDQWLIHPPDTAHLTLGECVRQVHERPIPHNLTLQIQNLFLSHTPVVAGNRGRHQPHVFAASEDHNQDPDRRFIFRLDDQITQLRMVEDPSFRQDETNAFLDDYLFPPLGPWLRTPVEDQLVKSYAPYIAHQSVSLSDFNAVEDTALFTSRAQNERSASSPSSAPAGSRWISWARSIRASLQNVADLARIRGRTRI